MDELGPCVDESARAFRTSPALDPTPDSPTWLEEPRKFLVCTGIPYAIAPPYWPGINHYRTREFCIGIPYYSRILLNPAGFHFLPQAAEQPCKGQ